ncbi:MAG: hypothetical protein PHO92_00555 [Candidatus Peribacteraceae bacterium]|nr:hypothetical protein [Candidatus Peribacteraceae bacterium]
MEHGSDTSDSGISDWGEDWPAALAKSEDLPPDARELTPEQRAILDTALRTLFTRHAVNGSDAVLRDARLGYCQKVIALYGMHLWTWYPHAQAMLNDAMALLPDFLHIHIQRRAQRLLTDRVTNE